MLYFYRKVMPYQCSNGLQSFIQSDSLLNSQALVPRVTQPPFSNVYERTRPTRKTGLIFKVPAASTPWLVAQDASIIDSTFLVQGLQR